MFYTTSDGKRKIKRSLIVKGLLSVLKSVLSVGKQQIFIFWEFVKKNKIKFSILVLFGTWYYWILPRRLFDVPYTFVVESNEGLLLGAKIASDGQWRFPPSDSVPIKFKKCLITYEDNYFYKHPGFNPVSMWNAFRENLTSGKIVRGGSTLTQQVARLARKNQKRTYLEKIIEFVWSTRIELRYSKEEILQLYSAHAPFGGNVVGIEMAAWRYFGVPSHQLSWAECATLAVLPNQPSLIYPGKNQSILLNKRNRLLKLLYQKGEIDELTYHLALQENLPQKPNDLPVLANHLVEHLANNTTESKVESTIQYQLQERVNQIVKNYYLKYKQNEVYNIAVLVVDVETRQVISYIGNSPTDKLHSKDVDIIHAARSTGSILKPFLVAEMMNAGMLLPDMLIPDIPTQISGFSPQNYNSTYDGAVSVSQALARSLNIPFVLLLQKYGVNNFYEDLKHYGHTHINRHPSNYGLSLILGGAESSLWDLCGTYAAYASILNYYTSNQQQYRRDEFQKLSVDAKNNVDFGSKTLIPPKMDASSIYLTFKAMLEVNRVSEDEAWKYYSSATQISWKTGTSYGNRDAWAIGLNPKYLVGVWVGNASGEGRPNLTGVGSASPVMFDVFNLLPKVNWFKRPEQGMMYSEICNKSGFLGNPNCTSRYKWINNRGEETDICPYCIPVFLEKDENKRVNSNCVNRDDMVKKTWFVLPPVMEFYYRRKNVSYESLPPFKAGCVDEVVAKRIQFIYPQKNATIYLTRNHNGNYQPLVLKAAVANRNSEVFWYLNRTFIGSTHEIHEMSVLPESGNHSLTIMDEDGNEERIEIVVISH